MRFIKSWVFECHCHTTFLCGVLLSAPHSRDHPPRREAGRGSQGSWSKMEHPDHAASSQPVPSQSWSNTEQREMGKKNHQKGRMCIIICVSPECILEKALVSHDNSPSQSDQVASHRRISDQSLWYGDWAHVLWKSHTPHCLETQAEKRKSDNCVKHSK